MSGFELELYSHHEWGMIYWYLAEVLSKQVDIIEGIIQSWPDPELAEESEAEENDDRATHAFISTQRRWAESLSYMAKGLRDVCFSEIIAKSTLISELADSTPSFPFSKAK